MKRVSFSHPFRLLHSLELIVHLFGIYVDPLLLIPYHGIGVLFFFSISSCQITQAINNFEQFIMFLAVSGIS